MGLSNVKRLEVAERIRLGNLTVAAAASRHRVSRPAVYRWVAKLKRLRSRFSDPADPVPIHLVPGRPRAAGDGLVERIEMRLKASQAVLRDNWDSTRTCLKGHPKGQCPKLPMRTIRDLVQAEGFRGSESSLRRLLVALGIATEGQGQRRRARRKRRTESRRN